MEATKVNDMTNGLDMEKIWGLNFEHQGISMETRFITYNSGILFLQCFNYRASYEQRIELMAGCFEEGSNIEEILRKYKILETFENLDGIVMTIGRIPILATRWNHDPHKLYAEWKSQMDAQKDPSVWAQIQIG